jgi:hypothetical protein
VFFPLLKVNCFFFFLPETCEKWVKSCKLHVYVSKGHSNLPRLRDRGWKSEVSYFDPKPPRKVRGGLGDAQEEVIFSLGSFGIVRDANLRSSSIFPDRGTESLARRRGTSDAGRGKFSPCKKRIS